MFFLFLISFPVDNLATLSRRVIINVDEYPNIFFPEGYPGHSQQHVKDTQGVTEYQVVSMILCSIAKRVSCTLLSIFNLLLMRE